MDAGFPLVINLAVAPPAKTGLQTISPVPESLKRDRMRIFRPKPKITTGDLRVIEVDQSGEERRAQQPFHPACHDPTSTWTCRRSTDAARAVRLYPFQRGQQTPPTVLPGNAGHDGGQFCISVLRQAHARQRDHPMRIELADTMTNSGLKRVGGRDQGLSGNTAR